MNVINISIGIDIPVRVITVVTANVINRSIGIGIPVRVISYHWINEQATSHANNVSQSMTWSDALKFKRMAYECIFSSRLTRIIPTPKPSYIASLPSTCSLCPKNFFTIDPSASLLWMYEMSYVCILAAHFTSHPSLSKSFSISSIGPSVTTVTLCFLKETSAWPPPSLPSEHSVSSHSFIAGISSEPFLPSE
ncbi:hypothetical protein Tco_0478262 [Tanacetum coccineum]